MADWSTFADQAPDLARVGETLLYQGADVAFAFLATVAPDKGPRVHPVYPVLAAGSLWLFIVNMSPKYRDLHRNGRFALHALPTEAGGEEFHIRGRAGEIVDRETRTLVMEVTESRQGTQDFEALFRCDLESVLYTKWDNWGTENAWPNYFKWRARSSRTPA